MSEVEHASAPAENRYHHYVGNRIPWYVRLIWVLFWCFVAYYGLTYLIPNLQRELLAPR